MVSSRFGDRGGLLCSPCGALRSLLGACGSSSDAGFSGLAGSVSWLVGSHRCRWSADVWRSGLCAGRWRTGGGRCGELGEQRWFGWGRGLVREHRSSVRAGCGLHVAGANNGSAGAPGTGCALDAVLGENNFQAWFPGRNGFYTYANLCKAINKYPPFATTGDTTAKKREVAAFFANVARETGMLKYIDQINHDPANGNYWGRGPLQLTWDYNYKACGAAIGENLLGQPTLVSTDGAITWETALWFWMTNDGGTGKTPHAAIVAGSFGGTIDAINGGLECNGSNEGANERIDHYKAFTQALGVDPGNALTCW